MKTLAIDFGKKRLGFAVGHRQTGLVSPVMTWKRLSPTLDLEQIKQLIGEHEVDDIVIGCPLHMDGTDSPLSRQATQFASFLAKRISLPVHMIDERLSSSEAEARLYELPGPFMRNKNALDAMSAVIILERHFKTESTK